MISKSETAKTGEFIEIGNGHKAAEPATLYIYVYIYICKYHCLRVSEHQGWSADFMCGNFQ